MTLEEILANAAARLNLNEATLVLLLGSSGALILVLGLASAFLKTNTAAVRIAGDSEAKRRARMDKALLVTSDEDAKGFMKALMPTDRQSRSAVELKLQQAGIVGAGALRKFMLVRVGLSLGLSVAFIGAMLAARVPGVTLPFGSTEPLQQMSLLANYVVITLLLGFGYMVPMKYLDDKVEARRRRIEYSFPNALDLMRIATESGLGFDAAMTRVGNELAKVSPDIAYEFLTVQRQVSAGRPREAAMRAMADRTGVDTVRSFTSVVQQSLQFGSSIAQALTTYADELRDTREMKAQEMANKLPVKMSAVLGALMLPALILLTLGPTVIRYVELMGS